LNTLLPADTAVGLRCYTFHAYVYQFCHLRVTRFERLRFAAFSRWCLPTTRLPLFTSRYTALFTPRIRLCYTTSQVSLDYQLVFCVRLPQVLPHQVAGFTFTRYPALFCHMPFMNLLRCHGRLPFVRARVHTHTAANVCCRYGVPLRGHRCRFAGRTIFVAFVVRYGADVYRSRLNVLSYDRRGGCRLR